MLAVKNQKTKAWFLVLLLFQSAFVSYLTNDIYPKKNLFCIVTLRMPESDTEILNFFIHEKGRIDLNLELFFIFSIFESSIAKTLELANSIKDVRMFHSFS